MEIIVHANPEALDIWNRQGFLKVSSRLPLKKKNEQAIQIELRLNPEEISKIETIDDFLIYHRANWRRPGPDKGDSL